MFILKVLWILHFHLYPTTRFFKKDVNGKKDVMRYTGKDSQISFIYIDKTLQALENHIDFLKKKKENIQPFILAIGDSIEEKINQFYVYFDDILMPFSSFIRSLDICFKTLHLFNLEYSQACQPFWNFIELYLFNINSGSKKNSKVIILVDDLKKLNIAN